MLAERIVVCTPTYHRAKALQRAVSSVLGQSYRELEHIVVKDGCERGPDCDLCRETDDVGQALMLRDPRFRYISLTEHKGGYGYWARNHAIAQSGAPLIAYLDDDNWWEPNHLSTLHAALTAQQAAFAFSGTIIRDFQGREVLRRIARKPFYGEIDTNELLHRRGLIDKYGDWIPATRELHLHDWELVCRWMRGQEPYAATGLATANYELNPRDPVLRFRLFHLKRRVLNTLSALFVSDQRRYRTPVRPGSLLPS